MGMLEWGLILGAAAFVAVCFLILIAVVIAKSLGKPKAKASTAPVATLVAPLAPSGRHEGHDFVDAFRKLKDAATADKVKANVGDKGASEFMGELSTYLGGDKPIASAPVPKSPPAP